ncbi:MAG: hypothetical protein CFE44_08710 [Burkholderiales bacterium PBB4]|nr:MAG: hypothetical protein CFE44_08710 [Burkholderiales bacterium PBB4]
MGGYLLAASIAPLVVLGVLAFGTAKRVVIEQAEAENARLVAGFSSYLRLYNDQVEDLAANIAGNEDIGTSLRRADARSASNFENLEMRANMGRLLNSYVRIKGLVSIDVFSLGGAHFHVGETLNASKVDSAKIDALLQEAKASVTPVLWRGIDANINTGSGQAQVISVVRAIEHYTPATGKSDTVGLLVINLNDEVMRTYLRGLSLVPGMQLLQLDRYGNVMLHSDSAQFGKRLAPELLALIRARSAVGQFSLNGEEVLMNVSTADDQRRQRVVITPRQQLVARINSLAVDTFLLIGLGLLISLAITWNFARTVAAPIRAVSRGFYRLANRPEAVHLALPARATQDEIGQLVTGYNNHLLALQEQQTMVAELQESQAQRSRTELQLRDSETQLRAILDEMPVGVFLVDRQERIFLRNRHFIEMFGYTEADAPDLATWWGLAHPDAEERRQVQDTLKAMRTTTADGRMAWTPAVYRVRRKDGVVLHVEVAGVGTQSGFICTFVDYTQHQAHQLQLVEAKTQAEAASYAKSEFLANMSHEIRTPMNGILGMLRLLQHTNLSAQQRDYAGKAQSATQALLGIINDILDFSKVEAGRLDLHAEHFLLSEVLSDLTSVLEASQYNSSTQLHVEVEPEVPNVLVGDSLRLRQVLINLVGNAIKFTREGNVWVTVKALGVHADTVRLGFSVRDTGIGIAADKVAYVFEGFSQAESSTTRRFGGTGLGLAISRRLVALMGGHLQVESTLGAGSRFFFDIALGLGNLDQVKSTRPEAEPSPELTHMPAPRPLEGFSLLLVEDNLLNQQVAVELLRRSGATVAVAGGGVQGVQMALEAVPRYDAILMDLQMPDIDGLEATRQILAQAQGVPAPVIAMTANAMASDREACLASGMVDHVSKPIDLDHLIAVLVRHVRREPELTPFVEPEPVLLDVDAAVNRMGGDQQLYLQIARSFRQEVQDQFVTLQTATRAQRWQDAARHAHTLKGLSGTLGAVALAHAAQIAEKSLVALSQDGVPAGWDAANTLGGMEMLLGQTVVALAALDASGDPDASSTTAAPVDRAGASQALAQLIELLKAHNMRSTTESAALRSRFEDVLGVPLVQLDEAVQQLRFGDALGQAQVLLERVA